MAKHGVVVADVAGVISGWDAGAVELFGYTAGEAVGQRIDLIVPEHLRAAHWVGFERAMTEPRVKDLAADLPVLCSDGQIRVFAGLIRWPR
jgi:PAS domain S-box-containing protein